MIIYIYAIISSLISSIIESYNKKDGHLLFGLNIFLLFVICACRAYDVGTDTNNYLDIYKSLSVEYIRGVEYGWYALMWISKEIFGSYRIFLMIVSFLTILFIKKSICVFSKNWNLSLYYFIVFYFYFQSFNIMRQMLATSIVLYAYTFVDKQKIISFFKYVTMAAFIHTSSLIALPLYFVSRIHISKQVGVLLIVLSFIFSALIVPIVLEYVSGIEMYSMYIYGEIKEESYISKNLLLHSLVAAALFFDKNKGGLFNIFFIGLLIVNVLSLFEVLGRIGLYMKIAIILILPNAYFKINGMKINATLYVCIASLLLVSCIIMLLANTEGVYPYSFIK